MEGRGIRNLAGMEQGVPAALGNQQVFVGGGRYLLARQRHPSRVSNPWCVVEFVGFGFGSGFGGLVEDIFGLFPFDHLGVLLYHFYLHFPSHFTHFKLILSVYIWG